MDLVDHHAAAAQRAAEEHLTQCVMSMHDDDVPEPDDMAGAFCGCTTCEVREVLHAAYPHLRAMWEADQAAT